MIFKKPYAFLIKYFKVINFVLAVLSVYVAYRSYNIINFFNEYIDNNYSGNFYPGFYTNYITAFFYFIIILIIIGSLIMFSLLIYKKKPTKAYVTSIIYYIILLIILTIFKNVMVTLETTVITAEIARIYRDISLLAIVPQVYLILMFVLRGFGFNIRKFNFEQDLKELEISEQDDEEIEVTFKKDGVKLQRNFRRFGREFGYYLKENKFIVIIISFLLLIGLGFIIYIALPEKVNQNYKQGESFNVGNLNYTVEDSIISNLDYHGDSLGKNTYYVVAKLLVENNSDEDSTIDYNDFRLEIGKKFIYPSKEHGDKFIDYAENYYGSSLKANSRRELSLIYKISNTDIKKNYNIKISSGSASSKNIQVGKYNNVTITPIIIEKVTTIKEINQGEEINFKDTNLGNTTLTLSNALITKSFVYEYEYCHKNNCSKYKDIVSADHTSNNKSLIVFDYVFNLDKEVPFFAYSSNVGAFAETFMKIRYEENDSIKYASVKNATPTNLTNKLVVETKLDINTLNNFSIALIIRNKEYIIKLK